MTEDKAGEKPTVPNIISDETGQYDARFLLWRIFCAEHDVAVETLPGDLPADIKAKWDQVKNKNMNRES